MMMDFRPLFFPAAGRARACRASQKPQAHRETRRASGDDERPFCEISMQPTALFRRAVAESDACGKKRPRGESIAGILSKTAGRAKTARLFSRSFHILLLFDHSVKGKSCRAPAQAKEKPCRTARQGKGMRRDYCFTLSTTARVISMSTYWPSGMSSRVAFSSFSRSSRPSTR